MKELVNNVDNATHDAEEESRVITIFTCGKISDRSIRQVLPDALAGYGGVQYFNGTELFCLGAQPPRFLVYEWENLPQEACTKGILLFKNSFSPLPGHCLPRELFPIFEARNTAASSFLRGTGVVAITCGTSPRDTLSLSSLDDNSAMVSLQRCITTLDGYVVEPGDISVSLQHSRSPHQILAAVSVLLLAGIPWEDGYVF